MIRLPLAPISRGDPRQAQTWGGRRVSRNLPAYQEWLDTAAFMLRAIWAEHGRGFVEGPCALDAVFVLRVPKANRKLLWGQPVAVRPDLDRYVHALQDAITKAGNVWEDDGRVSRVDAFKRYAMEDEDPCVLFSIERMSLGLSPGSSRSPLAGPVGNETGESPTSTFKNRGAFR